MTEDETNGSEEPDETRSDEASEPEESRKPISVRDLLPDPPVRPERRSRAGSSVREGGEDGGGEGDQDEGNGSRIPTPVRVAMDAEEPSRATRPPDELPSRQVEIEGEMWVVRVTGRTLTGTRPDSGALLMRLGFFRPGEGGEAEVADGTEEPVRVLLTVDRPLDALYDEDLAELFRRARPCERDEDVSI